MNNNDLQIFLKSFKNDAPVKVWIQIGDEELSDPNMAVATIDEIFEWQDELDKLSLDDDDFLTIFEFTDNLLDILESRLQLSPSFIEEMRQIEAKIESGDTSDFVTIDLDDFDYDFYECLQQYHTARTMRDFANAKTNIILCVKHYLGDLKVDIHNDILFIQRQNNLSCSTSIIADLLCVPTRVINDSQWDKGIWSINLKKV